MKKKNRFFCNKICLDLEIFIQAWDLENELEKKSFLLASSSKKNLYLENIH